jgi:hypothetical protein
MTCVIVGNHDFPSESLRAGYFEDDATRARRGVGRIPSVPQTRFAAGSRSGAGSW